MHQHTCELALAGRLLLWSWRHAVRAQRRREDLPHFVLYTLIQLPKGERVAAAAETLFAHWAMSARRPLHMSCPDARTLTRDESTFFEALTAAHFDFKDDVRLLLAELQHGGGLRRTSRACLELAALLRESDLPLSGRTKAFDFKPRTNPTKDAGTQSASRRA